MILVAVVATLFGPSRSSVLRAWTIGGCVASALALLSLTCAGLVGPSWPLRPSVFLLGLANGAFAVAAIGSMMALAGAGGRGREGLRIGLWGAAQALAFGLGGLVGATAADVVRYLLGSPGLAYACVFAVEGVLFLFAAGLAAQVGREKAAPSVARLPESFAADRYAADIATR